MSLNRLAFFKKKRGRRYTILTAYDTPTAEILARSGVDLLLVGDSLGMTVLGRPSTRDVTMAEMLHHAKAVRLGAPQAAVIGDMPYEAVRKGPGPALTAALRFMREAGMDAVKIEWGPKAVETTKLLVRNGVPVMGHVGLTPQTTPLRVQGATAGAALSVLRQAQAFEAAGAFSVLIECVPAAVAAAVTRTLAVPTAGIGAGAACDAQVLVFHDLAGLLTGFKPRFVKTYVNAGRLIERAVRRFRSDVRKGRFPRRRHAFGMPAAEQAAFKRKAAIR